MKEDVEQRALARTMPVVEAPLPNDFEAALCSIEDIIRAAALGWHKVYELGSRCFAVHMNFSLPKVNAMPVLTVRWGESAPGELCPEEHTEAEAFGFGLAQNPPRAEDSVCDHVHLSMPWSLSQTHLGKGAITVGGAIALVQSKVEAISQGRIHIAPDSIAMVLPVKRRKAEGGCPAAKPHYHLQFRQLLGGIPILGSVALTMHPSVEEKGSGYPMPAACIASEEEYCLGTSYMVEAERICEDVPLCSFSAMLKRWEWLILMGYVENIDRIRLGYVLYMDREDQERIWAVPAWVMSCIYHKNPGQSQKAHSEWREVIFNAQTGNMLEVDSLDPDLVYCPPIQRAHIKGHAGRDDLPR